MTLLNTIIIMLTGCGCFLVGINLMSRGFVGICEKPGSKILGMFKPKSGVQGVITGMTHSLVVQSSASTTVLTIRLLNIGAITLLEATPIVMGANIGTTLTAFIVSLSASNLSLYLAFLVFIGSMMFLSNKKWTRISGEILSGLGLVFVGLEVLKLYANDPQISSAIIRLFSATDNCLLLVLFGALVTALFQSSSVTTSIMVLMVSSALLPLEQAVYLVMGANLGSCITAFFASNGGNASARRIAFINVVFNIFGVWLFLIIIMIWGEEVFGWVKGLAVSEGLKLAIFHSIFNIGTTIVLLPFVKLIVLLAKSVIRPSRSSR